MAEDLPASGLAPSPRVDGKHDALRPENLGAACDERRIRQRGRVDRDLVGSMSEQLGHVRHAPHAAPHRQRDENLVRRAFDRVEQDLPRIRRRSDVEKDDLVSSLAVVGRRQLGRVACVSQLLKPHSLHHASVGDVKAGDDSLRRHVSCRWQRSWHTGEARRRRSSRGGTACPSHFPPRQLPRASARCSRFADPIPRA